MGVDGAGERVASHDDGRPPALAELCNEWVAADELAILPSLRNQGGQAHVDADLSSISWFAQPPFSGGYRTGVFRVNGDVPLAREFRWAPWGVDRRAWVGQVEVTSSTRLVPGKTAILWRIRFDNTSADDVVLDCEQELLSFVALSEVDWGWLYGSPWNHGHHHDYFATEKIRAVVADDPGQAHLIPSSARRLRIGVPRPVGIQRDEEAPAMLLDDTLPDHSTPDRDLPERFAFPATLHSVLTRSEAGAQEHLEGDVSVAENEQLNLDWFAIGAGTELEVRLSPADPAATGIILTHGNHPDSIQLGVEAGRPWLSIAGERLAADDVLRDGENTIAVRVEEGLIELEVGGTTVDHRRPWWDSDRWSAALEGGDALITDAQTGAVSRFDLATTPDSLTVERSRGLASWRVSVAAGGSAVIEFRLRMLAPGVHPEDAGPVAEQMDRVKTFWNELWQAAFTPGNPYFSGHLPTLRADADLERTYYYAALVPVYMRNPEISTIGAIYPTGGPRLGPTTVFFWDISEWARTFALLDPVALRGLILASLAQPYETSCFAFDTRGRHPLGNRYSANDWSLFRTIEHYVGITGDESILGEPVAGRTVIEHLRDMAFRVEERRASFGDGVLVDFGADPWELLECIPNYRHAVTSFNAGYVGLLDSYATLARVRGDLRSAERAEHLADVLADAVIGQYAGEGRWKIAFPDHEEVIGHCMDFQFVANEMGDRLPASIKDEMVRFVTTHLIDGDWMRALSPDDPVAPLSDRPDHGAAGAFAAWPAETALGLFRLGRSDVALDLLRRIHRSRSGALWGQGVEAVGDGRYRVAERGISLRDMASSASPLETILAGLFGIQGDFSAPHTHSGSRRVGQAELSGVRAPGGASADRPHRLG